MKTIKSNTLTNAAKPRLTTAEAAQHLECKNAAALLLLQAASVAYTRGTRHGPFLWDAGGVERLAATLHKSEAKRGDR